MGQLILNDVVQALRTGGFATQWGYPHDRIPAISQPVCAVNLQSADLTTGQTTVLVRVISPVELGAAGCEQAALEVGNILNDHGGLCSISSCSYDSRAEIFMVEVSAVYVEEKPRITINGSKLKYVTSFSAWKEVDSTINDWGTALWNFRFEEWIPVGHPDQPIQEGTFTLVHTGDHGTETFQNATWSYRKREWGPNGIRKTHIGVADDIIIETIE